MKTTTNFPLIPTPRSMISGAIYPHGPVCLVSVSGVTAPLV